MNRITRVIDGIRDGDTILVRTQSAGSGVWDPANLYDGAARAFRVVVQEGPDPVLELVPLGAAVMIERRLM